MNRSLLITASSLLLLANTEGRAQTFTGPSTAQSPYVVPVAADVKTTSILTAGETVNGYKMAGIPDGAGAWDNGDGTFTFLSNHEMPNSGGATHAHGSSGSFVSKWVIKKSDLSVVSGSDLMQKVNLWNSGSYTTYYISNPSSSAAFSRFCSGNLAAVSAFYNDATGLGTKARIFMNGEENGAEGRVMGHIATGAEAGTSYELPYLGKASWENYVANPGTGDKTVAIGTDDATPGNVYIYIGTKTSTGNEIHKAGLDNGKLYSVAVQGMLLETNGTVPAANTPFTMLDLGQVQNMTGAAIQTASNTAGATQFLRPEDGAWDPQHPEDFYFVTTNGFNSPSRMWRLRFSNISDLTLGGTITAVLDGTEGQQMMDNIGIDNWGHIMIQEDVGNNAHIGKIWQYTIATDALVLIAEHDHTRFLTGGANYLTQDEEASGIFDAQEILGPGMWLSVDQAHYSIPGQVYEGGQFFALYNPDSYNANPEISLEGNSTDIPNGAAVPATGNNTDMGNVSVDHMVTKTFDIRNAGPADLGVSAINITGANAGEFTLVSAPTFPLTIAKNAKQTITVQFKPAAIGLRKANIEVVNNDFDESKYNFAIQGVGQNTLNVGEVNTSSFMKLYPNPTGDAATVEVMLKKEEHVSVAVLDMQGKVVIPAIANDFAAGTQKIIVNTSALANGNYFVEVSAGNATTRTQLVIAH